MVVHELFDTVCRCFGSVTANPSGASTASTPLNGGEHDYSSTQDRRRTTSRLELQDREWDALFSEPTYKSGAPIQHKISPKKSSASNSVVDLEYAEALAKAKRAANPVMRRRKSPAPSSTSRRRGISKSRKSPQERRTEIFRSRPYDSASSPRSPSSKNQAPGNSISRFLSSHQGVASALCFATPIRDDNDGADDTSDTYTLNTCEDDTVTSTLYFDSKISHMVEKRPPMPLFHQFKVNAEDTDQLRRIVATDSHSSLKMVRLLQQVHDPHVKLDDSSSDDEEHHRQQQHHDEDAVPMDEDDIVPDSVKINSSSSSSNKSPTTPPPPATMSIGGGSSSPRRRGSRRTSS